MNAQTQTDANNLIFHHTNRHAGRFIAVTPSNSSMRHLHYGRIRLNGDHARVSFATAERETGLICLSGEGTIKTDDESYNLARYDAIYIPRNSQVEVETNSEVDFVECAAEVTGDYPLQVVRYKDIEGDSTLKFLTGGEANRRTINILLGKNVEAGRILAGVTQSEPGNWTSFPPHEHAAMLEELYVFYDMPAPAFGVQFVYTDTQEPEGVFVVRDGDCVLMPAGYHPNVAIPNHKINFIWIMAAHKEREDRQYGVVNVQPEFAINGSGLEASRK